MTSFDISHNFKHDLGQALGQIMNEMSNELHPCRRTSTRAPSPSSSTSRSGRRKCPNSSTITTWSSGDTTKLKSHFSALRNFLRAFLKIRPHIFRGFGHPLLSYTFHTLTPDVLLHFTNAMILRHTRILHTKFTYSSFFHL